jgi:hypothetical protein
MDHLPRLLHRPIESHDGTRLATHLRPVARTPACHSRTAASSPCSGRLLRPGEIVSHLPSRFPASSTRSFLRALPASARLDTFRCRGALAHTHTAVTCRMRPSQPHSPDGFPSDELRATLHGAESPPHRASCSSPDLRSPGHPTRLGSPSAQLPTRPARLHALHSEVTSGVDPSFDIPPDSCLPGSRLRQHQQRLPAPLCPPRSGPPSRFPKTMTPPSRRARLWFPNPEPVSARVSRTLVTQVPITPATLLSRRLPSGSARLATRSRPSCPCLSRVSQRRLCPVSRPEQAAEINSHRQLPADKNPPRSKPKNQSPGSSIYSGNLPTSFPVDESARDETTVWLPNR